MMKNEDFRASAKARGQRVASLRGMTRLSREALAAKYPIPPRTLQNWELGSATGLTEKGARKLITAAKAEGVHCTFEWLMYGVGEGPYFLHQAPAAPLTLPNQENARSVIANEITTLFHRCFAEHGIDLTVKDDGLAPSYKPGDYVAGEKCYKAHIAKLIGQDCIVQTADGEVLLRNLRPSAQPGYYTLACNNPQTTVLKPVLYDIEIISAAPVLLVLRKT